MLAAVSNIAQYHWHSAAMRRGSHWRRLGPTYLVLLSLPLVLADPMRHVLQDSGIWTSRSSSMYRPDCDPRGLHGFWCLSVTGVAFTLFTYLGFALLVAGVFWQVELVPKLRAAWREIRRARQAGQRVETGPDAV